MTFPARFASFCLVLGIAQTLFAQEFTPPGNEAQFQKQYEERIKKERLNGVYIPKNLDDACAQLTRLTSEEARAGFKKLPEDSVTMYLHRTLGQWMILNWSFYEGSRLSHYLRSAGVTYPDDMADFLILAWHRNLTGQAIELRTLVKFFKEKRRKVFEKEQAKNAAAGKVILEEKRVRPKPAAGGKQ